MCFRLLVLLLIRKGLLKILIQMRRILKLLPESREWGSGERREREYMKRENGECKSNLYESNDDSLLPMSVRLREDLNV